MRFTFLSAVLTLILAEATTATAHEYGTINGWGTLIDPDGDCAFLVEQHGVSIRVPDTAHDLSVELDRLNAPRILREVIGDFAIEVEVGGVFAPGEGTVTGRTAYNGAGLLLWQDERNYIRLERATLKRADQIRHYVNFEQRLAARIMRFGSPSDYEVDATQPCHLRLERKGSRILGAVKQGDGSWHELTPKSAPLPDRLKIGVVAVNASDGPFAPRFSSLEFQGAIARVAAVETAASGDPYTVPDSGVDDLVAFIKRVQAIRPKTGDEFTAHRNRSPGALATAAEKILKDADASPEATNLAKRIVFERDVKNISRLDATKQRVLYDEVLAFCTESQASNENLQLMMLLARGLEYSVPPRAEMAAEAYLATSELMAKSNSPRLTKQAEKMAGAARRMKLLGNEMEVNGTTMDGEEFELASYEGKVVLIDFWATWCGPCIAELPNVKKYYELYHDEGFEVIGICLDTSREKLEGFVEAQKIPWINLFEDNAGWEHPVANHYGVMAIPTVVLLNREGKAVSLRARGRELGRLLEEEFGPVNPQRMREVEEKYRSESMARRTPRPSVPQRNAQPPLIVHQNSAVYLAKPDGSDFRRVVRDDQYQWHGNAKLSPSGNQLAWDAHHSGLKSPSVFVGDLQGHVAHKIEGATRPIWLSDQTLLVDQQGNMTKVDLGNGLEQEVLTRGLYASLSANRRHLVFARGNDTFVRDIETGGEEILRLQPQARSFNGLAVSNDGQRIAYVGLKDRGEAIFVADIEDGEGDQVADESGSEHFPSFSPDGNKLMFTAGSIALDADHVVSRIYVVDLSSGESKPITSEDFYCRDGSWASDGQMVTMVAVDKSAVEKAVSAARPARPTSAAMRADRNRLRGGAEVAAPVLKLAEQEPDISNKMKSIGIALHNHHSTFKHNPGPIRADDGTALLSWRVAVLPFLGHKPLYAEFRLNEPWDSEHNKKLLARMPDVFQSGTREASSGLTVFQIPTGRGLFMEPDSVTRFRDVFDGLSNTIMLVEAGERAVVPWTKPADVNSDMQQLLRSLRSENAEGFHVCAADGATYFVLNSNADDLIKKYLTRNGREPAVRLYRRKQPSSER